MSRAIGIVFGLGVQVLFAVTAWELFRFLWGKLSLPAQSLWLVRDLSGRSPDARIRFFLSQNVVLRGCIPVLPS